MKCSYEVGWNDMEKDRLLDRTLVHWIFMVRWLTAIQVPVYMETAA